MIARTTALLLFAAMPVSAKPLDASLTRPSPALELFERDWVLMNWALKYFDSNHDILLEPNEAQAAAEAFRKLADTDGDGRITPAEYEAARAAILARD